MKEKRSWDGSSGGLLSGGDFKVYLKNRRKLLLQSQGRGRGKGFCMPTACGRQEVWGLEQLSLPVWLSREGRRGDCRPRPSPRVSSGRALGAGVKIVDFLEWDGKLLESFKQ